MTSTYLSLGALVLAFVTFIVTQVRTQRAASSAHVQGLETRIEKGEERIDKLEEELKASRAEVVKLEDENLRLMRKLLANGVS